MRLLSLSKDGAPMDLAMSLALSDQQVDHIVLVSRPLQPHERAAFLAKLFDDLLNRREPVGEGELGRLLRDLQSKHFTPPGEEKVAPASEQVTVRLAHEGVPVRAIARAVQVPSADVREALKTARADGYLIEIPCEDWPPGYPREQRLLELARLHAREKPALPTALRSIFKLAPLEIALLVVLLANEEMPRDRVLAHSPNSLRAKMCRVRKALELHGLLIETQYGQGYFMPLEHRRKAVELISEHMGLGVEAVRTLVRAQGRLMLEALRSGAADLEDA